MSNELEYNAIMTGASFLFFEFKQVIKLKLDGLTETEIRQKIVSDNIFQYEKTSSLKRMIPSLLRRVDVLEQSLMSMVLEEPLEVGKIINLYAIMKTDRLFFEFMNEIIKEKLQANEYFLEKKDLNSYFTYKAEQDESIANWSQLTVNKLKQVYLKILLETGLIKDKKSGELNRLIIDGQVKEHLINIGEKQYLLAMGE
ncbi:DUF1819 family protein [Bacillus salacetis]|uniref:DUF1819 family protein n=1 Tax=Bacillus salacetis TaxID=2315464 RepID=A0A3A1QWD7_9BACI|nr:DUF1819 family protein [Bacillus salacetis]RIW32677.1 DUF1819 family protein [Bacillus salacetis]